MTRDDRQELNDPLAAGALGRLREEPVPDMAPEVMRRVEALAAPAPERLAPLQRLGRAAGWLWRPQRISLAVRPAFGLAAAALVALLLGPPSTGAAPEAAPSVFVQFRLDVADARDVRLAGDFTDWRPAHELRQVAPGVWSVVVPVRPGVHEYAFVVDGHRWTADPLAELVADGFGGVNSRLAVLVPENGEAL
jgi:hypothetical protein